MLTTRQPTDDDVGFLTDVFLRAMRRHITAARGDWNEEQERRQFLQQLRLPETRIIVRDGVDVGFFMTGKCGEDLELHTICVAPVHQSQGIGTAITRQIINEARTQMRGVVLSVLKVNTPARSLYERLGFDVTEASSHHYRMRLVPPARA
jgi:ribosomal protein S18 acetylase RimI-like enzyme